jgi:hypothetical protein
MLISAALALVPVQASIERVVTDSVVQEVVNQDPPGLVSSSVSMNSIAVQVDFDLDPIPASGVELVGYEMDGELLSQLRLDFMALDPAGTVVYVGASGNHGAASPSGLWGAIDPFPWSLQFTPPSLGVVTAGDTASYTLDLARDPFTDSGSEAATWNWQTILQNPLFIAFAACRAEWATFRPSAGGATQVDLLHYQVTRRITLDVTRRYQLDVLPTVNHCSSLPNSTGATAQLSAYGSDAAGSEWLTIRAEGLPPQATAILFQGAAAGFTPMGSFNLCLGGQLQRRGGVQIADQGTADFAIDLVSITPGETLFFQVFHRDPVLAVAASDGASLDVR